MLNSLPIVQHTVTVRVKREYCVYAITLKRRNIKTEKLNYNNSWTWNSPDLSTVDYNMWKILQENMNQVHITTLDDIKYWLEQGDVTVGHGKGSTWVHPCGIQDKIPSYKMPI